MWGLTQSASGSQWVESPELSYSQHRKSQVCKPVVCNLTNLQLSSPSSTQTDIVFQSNKTKLSQVSWVHALFCAFCVKLLFNNIYIYTLLWVSTFCILTNSHLRSFLSLCCSVQSYLWHFIRQCRERDLHLLWRVWW